MADADDVLQGIIDNAATGIRRAKGDEGEVQNYELEDQIAAHEYVVNAGKNKPKGLKAIVMQRAVPPSSV